MQILFVCTGNICRSPMAEGLMKKMLSEKGLQSVRVASAGTHALEGHPASGNAVAVMASQAVDITGHRGRQLDNRMLATSDLVLVMEPLHLEFIRYEFTNAIAKTDLLARFHPSGRLSRIEDPYGGPLPEYQACARILAGCIKQVLDMEVAVAKLTIRQQIANLLTSKAMDLAELAAFLDLTEKDLAHHLEHVKRTASRSGRKIKVVAARCRNCDFVFSKTNWLKRPGRCPRCRQSRIDGPWISLKQG